MFKKNLIAIPIILGLLMAGCIDSNEDDNKKPKASIVADNTIIFQGESVIFNGNGSFDLDGNIEEYKWDFGDGSYDNKIACVHKFLNDGIFIVTLSVRDNEGNYGKTTIQITVKKVVNQLPIAIGNYKVFQPSIYQGDTINFDASESYDKDGTIINYKWNLGTGLIYDEKMINYIFDSVGSYSINLTVEDNNHTKGYDSFTILVEPAIEITILEHEHRNGIFVEEYYWIKIAAKNKGGKNIDLSDSNSDYFWISSGGKKYKGYISSGEDEFAPHSNEQKGLDFDYFPENLTPEKLYFKYNDDYQYEVYIT